MGSICFKGRIYSGQKCAFCGSSFKYDPDRHGLFCLNHPEQKAMGSFTVHFGKTTRKRFKTYPEAERFLEGLRWEVDKGTYDPRDYSAGNPLAFAVLAEKWLSIKKQETKPRSFANLRCYMNKAIREWSDRNVKTIGYAEIEDFLFSQGVSNKTKANMKSGLHSFFEWVSRREKIPAPEFPEISFELGWRQTVDKETQWAIIEQVKKISYRQNPKIWLGVKWLSTYISIRPGELIGIRERDIDIETGCLFVIKTKEKKPKVVPLVESDINILKTFPPAFPDLFFFRHPSGISGVKGGEKFGPRYLYKWWKRACDDLGIKGVDLYGGTRHSSALALRKFASPEQIKRATMHSTNKAFERYFKVETEEVRSIYELASRRDGV